MEIVDSDLDFFVPSDNGVNYDLNNPIRRMVRFVEEVELGAEREHYLPDSLQYLVPFSDLGLYGPSANRDPRNQDNKNDFEKQNVATFRLGDFYVARGYATAGGWTGAFVKVSYRGGPFSGLGKRTNGQPGQALQLRLKVGEQPEPALVRVPYNPSSQRYETELWAFDGSVGSLRSLLDKKGQAALDAQLIQTRSDVVRGTIDAFSGPSFDADREAAYRAGQPIHHYNRVPGHAMHPLRNLRIETHWGNEDGIAWDNLDGSGYIVEFGMLFRGWNNYLQVGISKNPHGGVGALEFRNLFSNYFGHEQIRKDHLGSAWKNELGRDLNPYNFDANTWRPTESPGPKAGDHKRELFFSVEYADLHILQPDCGIGIHRHRDNQEVFLLLAGKGLMIVGDWCKFANRERAFEIRTMVPGDLTVCKTGQLHALYNAQDEIATLFMFGAYD